MASSNSNQRQYEPLSSQRKMVGVNNNANGGGQQAEPKSQLLQIR